jgi:hypothetical protein
MLAPRTIIVGDIHGCAREFDDLLALVAHRPRVDRLVLVGDLVARGPSSRAVVERARELACEGVRGNHDEKVLSWWRVASRKGRRDADRSVRLSERHRAVVESLRDKDFAWLATLPLTLSLDVHNLTVVHAGVDPRREPATCDEETLLTVRSIDERGEPSRKLLDVSWASRWRGPRHLVFGHDARRNLQLEAYATGLDTGCCYGRTLTAMVLAEGQRVPDDLALRRALLVSVPAREPYCATGTGDGPE